MELSLFVDDGSKKLSALVYSKGVPKFASGNVVFLLHGFQDNAASFYKLAPMLTERTNFTFVCLEFSGHGKSDHAGVSNHFNYVFDVIDAANALRVEKFGLIGHSMGAIVSLMLAGSALDRVTFCVAIDTLGMIGTKSDQESAILLQKSLAQRSEILKRQPRIYSSMEECISRWKMSALAPLGDENVAALVERSVEFIVDDSLNSSPGFRFRHDPRLKALSPFRLPDSAGVELLRRIQCPSAFILATDRPSVWWTADEEKHRTSLVSNVYYGTGGHHLHMSNATACLEFLMAFFQEHKLLQQSELMVKAKL